MGINKKNKILVINKESIKCGFFVKKWIKHYIKVFYAEKIFTIGIYVLNLITKNRLIIYL